MEAFMRMVCIAAAVLFCYFYCFPIPSDLKAEFRKGKTFITFTEESGTQGYRIYRSLSQITTISGLTPLVTVNHGSSYDSRYDFYHIIQDSGTPLSATTGLFVYTPKSQQPVYYAVTSVTDAVEDTGILEGQNALSTPVAEEYWQWPHGVFRARGADSQNFYYYWMDYFDWGHGYDYYGDLFSVCNINTGQNLPLVVYLHGAGNLPPGPGTDYGLPWAAGRQGYINMALVDHGDIWWYGWSNNYTGDGYLPQTGDTIVNYLEMRIIYYTQYLMHHGRYSIDTSRVYLSGGSMGGTGTNIVSSHYPDMWAGIYPKIPEAAFTRYASIPFWDQIYGTEAQHLTARNGIYIYDWTNSFWVMDNFSEYNFPPCVIAHGSKDGLMTMNDVRGIYQHYAECRRGVWGGWYNVGHTVPTAPTLDSLLFRFKRGEMHPAFSNTTQDDNYGQKGDTNAWDSTGFMNTYIDWTSSLHDMGLPDDDLIDCADSISITMKSTRPNTVTDITPRRVQNFVLTNGAAYTWKNVDVVSGNNVASGIVIADEHGAITIDSFSVSGTGNKLIITCSGDCPAVLAGSRRSKGLDGVLSVSPNPFNPDVRIVLTNSQLAVDNAVMTIYAANGTLVHRETAGKEQLITGVFWNAADFPSGMYIVRLQLAHRTFNKTVILLK